MQLPAGECTIARGERAVALGIVAGALRSSDSLERGLGSPKALKRGLGSAGDWGTAREAWATARGGATAKAGVAARGGATAGESEERLGEPGGLPHYLRGGL